MSANKPRKMMSVIPKENGEGFMIFIWNYWVPEQVRRKNI